MKKLSTLIAMILCVTIGAVYAGWAYSKPGEKIATYEDEAFVTMDSAEEKGSQGTFNITHNFKMKIVPLADKEPSTNVPNANHVTALQFYTIAENAEVMPDENALITIKFTPNASADVDIKKYGPDANLYLIDSTVLTTVGKPMQYDDKDIFDYEYTQAAPLTVDWGEPDAEGVFTVTLKAAEVISLSEQFYLGSIEEFGDFKAALGGNVKVVISDATPDGAND